MAEEAHNSRYPKTITYSEKYMDAKYEYRHVLLPRTEYEQIKVFAGKRVLTEHEWRTLGVQQSRGWEHYTWHCPEPHILLFRRPIGTDAVTGLIDPIQVHEMKEAYQKNLSEYGP